MITKKNNDILNQLRSFCDLIMNSIEFKFFLKKNDIYLIIYITTNFIKI